MLHPRAQNPKGDRRSEWRGARDALSRLMTARVTEFQQLHWAPLAATAANASNAFLTINVLTVAAEGVDARPVITVDSPDLARGYAEIERASATVRQLEPQLEIWLPDMVPASEPRPPYSVWAVIGGIWISTISVVAGGIGALVYLFS